MSDKKTELLNFDIGESMFLKKMIGSNLKSERANLQLTYTQVSTAIWGDTKSGSRSKICGIEAGNRALSVMELLAFQRLYGFSIDYICGLSTESEPDVMSGTVNQVANRIQGLVENLTAEITSVVASNLKPTNKNDSQALLASAKLMCSQLAAEINKGNKDLPKELIESTRRTMFIIKKIEAEAERQDKQISMQVTQIKDRLDKEDRHIMQRDLKKPYQQYSLPLLQKNESYK